MSNIQCFTHGDLDGVVSNLLFCKYYNLMGYSHSTESGATGESIDRKIVSYINSRRYNENDIIIITDLCMSYDIACMLDSLPNQKIHIDHHDTSKEIMSTREEGKNDFSWSYIEEGDSATMLVYRYLDKVTKGTKFREFLEMYRPLVVVTDLWDTKPRESEDFIAWLTPINDILTLMNSIGFSDFKARFLINPSIELSEVELAKVQAVQRVKTNVMRFTNVYIRKIQYQGVTSLYGVCFGGLYRSEVADYIFQTYSDLLFVFIIDMNSERVSLRLSRNERGKDLDLTIIAKQFDDNGGGHPFACGFAFAINEYKQVIDKIFNADFSLI